MIKQVWIVSDPMLGWDCIMGVFNYPETTAEQLKEEFGEEEVVIQLHNIESWEKE